MFLISPSLERLFVEQIFKVSKCDCKGTTKKSKYQIFGIKKSKKMHLFLFLGSLHRSHQSGIWRS